MNSEEARKYMKAHVSCGGSMECMASCARWFALFLTLMICFIGCGGDSNGGQGNSQQLVGQNLVSVNIGDSWRHITEDAKLTVESIDGSTLGIGIGIDGSQQLHVKMTRDEWLKTVVSSTDWTAVEIGRMKVNEVR